MNYKTGQLLVDCGQKFKDREEHYIRKYKYRDMQMQQSLEGKKEILKFFQNHVVEVKSIVKGNSTGSQLVIYDFTNGITVYWTTSHSKIIDIEIEDDAIYYLAENVTGKQATKVLCKLYEMENNVKIHTLMKKNLHVEAKQIAVAAKFPPEIIAEIDKEYADNLYNKNNFDEAINQFIETIGFLNPSYVIQRYIQVPQLDNLIKYLEKLIEGPSMNLVSASSAADYNKDYTALLLNCYVKKEKFPEIKRFIAKAIGNPEDGGKNKNEESKKQTNFDVATAIDVCRQQKSTREEAIKLAKYKEMWKLLVQIQIENEKNWQEALNVIKDKINNLREKVDCLQIYGPKLLKESVKQQD